jgi:uncharacterized membrane protein
MGSHWMYLLAFAGGLMEFIVAGILFLMAGFSITGYAVFSRIAAAGYAKDAASRAELILGIGAVFGFIIGLAASVSAMERKSWVWCIIGALTTAFWGVLLCFFAMLAIQDPGDASFAFTIGSVVILLSALNGLLVIASRHEFDRRIS